MRAGIDQRTGRVIVRDDQARCRHPGRARLGQHAQRRSLREARLADALRPDEQPCVVERSAAQRRGESGVRVGIAEEFSH
jgi:hypothetical protein